MAKKNDDGSPLMRQHAELKKKFPDAVLLFRVGDFYETFGEDARTASRILGLTLTRKMAGGGEYRPGRRAVSCFGAIPSASGEGRASGGHL